MHGRTYVDERAVLLEGNGATGTLDSYYYLLQELSTVTGLMKKNGTLAEAYVYDAYGKVTQWGYRNFDFDRDGDVDSGDYGIVLAAGEFDCCPTSDPMTDGDMDGDCDENDLLMVQQTSSGAPPITLHASGVGNPYFFTARRLHLYENLALSGINPNKQVQYNRARHYSPEDGRWLQRDPAGHVDSRSLFEYVRSRATSASDPTGLVILFRPGGTFRGFLKGTPTEMRSEFQLWFRPDLWTFYEDLECLGGRLCDIVDWIQAKRVSFYRQIGPIVDEYTSDWGIDSSTPPFYTGSKLPLAIPVDNTYWQSAPEDLWPGAWFFDMPGWTSSIGIVYYYHIFEVCAVCASGLERGMTYGCIKWGHGFSDPYFGDYAWIRFVIWGDNGLSWGFPNPSFPNGGGPNHDLPLGGNTDPTTDPGYFFDNVIGSAPSPAITSLFDAYFP